jgi:hypothetical protein
MASALVIVFQPRPWAQFINDHSLAWGLCQTHAISHRDKSSGRTCLAWRTISPLRWELIFQLLGRLYRRGLRLLLLFVFGAGIVTLHNAFSPLYGPSNPLGGPIHVYIRIQN